MKQLLTALLLIITIAATSQTTYDRQQDARITVLQTTVADLQKSIDRLTAENMLLRNQLVSLDTNFFAYQNGLLITKATSFDSSTIYRTIATTQRRAFDSTGRVSARLNQLSSYTDAIITELRQQFGTISTTANSNQQALDQLTKSVQSLQALWAAIKQLL